MSKKEYCVHSLISTKVGVLLVNLGTPSSYRKRDIRYFLNEFLSDSRVVELPNFLWRIFLRCFITPILSVKLYKKYSSIWTAKGSPLAFYTQMQAKKLQALLTKRCYKVKVDYGMRYGQHSISEVLKRMKTSGIENVLILPLYPQYAASTTASSFDAVSKCIAEMRDTFSLRFIKSFAKHPVYIDTLVNKIKAYWSNIGSPNFANNDKLLLSFHSLPKKTIDLGDPYYDECQITAALIRRALNLTESECMTTFQSRFGYRDWLKPYTADKVLELSDSGSKRLDIFCPGFVCDCLETLDEIDVDVRALFEMGGGVFNFIPCLNVDDAWIQCLGELVEQNLQGW